MNLKRTQNSRNLPFCVFFLLHTYFIEVIPGLNEAFPEGEDVAGPSWEEKHHVSKRQHVVNSLDEAKSLMGNLLLQAPQSGLKQDGGYTCK